MNFPNINQDEHDQSCLQEFQPQLNCFSLASNRENRNIANIHSSEKNQSNEGNLLYLKSATKSTRAFSGQNDDIGYYPSYLNDPFLISPIKDYKFKDYGLTPLKNNNGFYSPSIPFEFKMDTPYELKFDNSARRVLFTKDKEIVQGKKINFNNIDGDESCTRPIANTTPITFSNKTIIKNHIKICCTCTKTNCQKKYCACYANGKFCEGCDCKNCKNQPIGNVHNTKQISITSLICNCTKSNCTKKYCECFKVGKGCSPLCRCVNCTNCSKKSFEKDNFFTEAMGIEISKGKMDIKKRKLTLGFEDIHSTPKLTRKKRMRMSASTRLNTATPPSKKQDSAKKVNTRGRRKRVNKPNDD